MCGNYRRKSILLPTDRYISQVQQDVRDETLRELHRRIPDAAVERNILPYTDDFGRLVFRHMNALLLETPYNQEGWYINISDEYDKPKSFSTLDRFTNKTSCGHKFSTGDLLISCKDCEYDEFCLLCVNCFNHKVHEDHEVIMKVAESYSGSCDCGDQDAWRRELGCSIHKSAIRDDARGHFKELSALAPLPISEHIRNILKTCLDFIVKSFLCICAKSKKDAYSGENRRSCSAIECRLHSSELSSSTQHIICDGSPLSPSYKWYMEITTTSDANMDNYTAELLDCSYLSISARDLVMKYRTSSRTLTERVRCIIPIDNDFRDPLEVFNLLDRSVIRPSDRISLECVETVTRESCGYYLLVWVTYLAENITVDSIKQKDIPSIIISHVVNIAIVDALTRIADNLSFEKDPVLKELVKLSLKIIRDKVEPAIDRSVKELYELTTPYGLREKSRIKNYRGPLPECSGYEKSYYTFDNPLPIEVICMLGLKAPPRAKDAFFNFQSKVMMYCYEYYRPHILRPYIVNLPFILHWYNNHEDKSTSSALLLLKQITSTEYMCQMASVAYPILAILAGMIRTELELPHGGKAEKTCEEYMERLASTAGKLSIYNSVICKTELDISTIIRIGHLAATYTSIVSTPQGRDIHFTMHNEFNFASLAQLCSVLQGLGPAYKSSQTGLVDNFPRIWISHAELIKHIFKIVCIYGNNCDSMLRRCCPIHFFGYSWEEPRPISPNPIAYSKRIINVLQRCAHILVLWTAKDGDEAFRNGNTARDNLMYRKSFENLNVGSIVAPLSSDDLAETEVFHKKVSWIPKYEISARGTSFFHPLHLLFAVIASSVCIHASEWIKSGYDILDHLKSFCKADLSGAYSDSGSFWCSLFTIDSVHAKSKVAIDQVVMNVLDYPLRLLVLESLTTSGIWLLNGDNLSGEFDLLHSFGIDVKAHYVFLMQIASIMLEHDTFMVWLINKFEIEEVLRPQTKNECDSDDATSYKQDSKILMVRGLIILLLNILNDRSAVIKSEKDGVIEKVVIGILTSEPTGLTYDNISKRVGSFIKDRSPPCPVRGSPSCSVCGNTKCLSDILQNICDMKSDEPLESIVKYTIKPSVCESLNMWDVHFNHLSVNYIEAKKIEKLTSTSCGSSPHNVPSRGDKEFEVWSVAWCRSMIDVKEELARNVDKGTLHLLDWIGRKIAERTVFCLPPYVVNGAGSSEVHGFLDSKLFFYLSISLLGQVYSHLSNEIKRRTLRTFSQKSKFPNSNYLVQKLFSVNIHLLASSILTITSLRLRHGQNSAEIEPDGFLYNLYNLDVSSFFKSSNFYDATITPIRVIIDIALLLAENPFISTYDESITLRSLVELIYICFLSYGNNDYAKQVIGTVEQLLKTIEERNPPNKIRSQFGSQAWSLSPQNDEPSRVVSIGQIMKQRAMSRITNLQENFEKTNVSNTEVTDPCDSNPSTTTNDSVKGDSYKDIPSSECLTDSTQEIDSASKDKLQKESGSFQRAYLRTYSFPKMECIVCRESDEEDLAVRPERAGGVICHAYRSRIERATTINLALITSLLENKRSRSSGSDIELEKIPSDYEHVQIDNHTISDINDIQAEDHTIFDSIHNDSYFVVPDSSFMRVENYGVYIRPTKISVSSCGHMIHYACFDRLRHANSIVGVDSGICNESATVHLRRNFKCPLCNSISNCILPLIWKRTTELVVNANDTVEGSEYNDFNSFHWWNESLCDYTAEADDIGILNFINYKSFTSNTGIPKYKTTYKNRPLYQGRASRDINLIPNPLLRQKEKKLDAGICHPYQVQTVNCDEKRTPGYFSGEFPSSQDDISTGPYENAQFRLSLKFLISTDIRPAQQKYVKMTDRIIETLFRENFIHNMDILESSFFLKELRSSAYVPDHHIEHSKYDTCSAGKVYLNVIRRMWQHFGHTIEDMEIRSRLNKPNVANCTVFHLSDAKKVESRRYVYTIFEELSSRNMLHMRLMSESLQAYPSALSTFKCFAHEMKTFRKNLLLNVFRGFYTESWSKYPKRFDPRLTNKNQAEFSAEGIPLLQKNAFSVMMDVIFALLHPEATHKLIDLYSWIKVLYVMELIKCVVGLLMFIKDHNSIFLGLGGPLCKNYTNNTPLKDYLEQEEARRNANLLSFFRYISKTLKLGKNVEDVLSSKNFSPSLAVDFFSEMLIPLLRRLVILLQVRFNIVPNNNVKEATSDSEFNALRKYLMLPQIDKILCPSNTVRSTPFGLIISGWLKHVLLFKNHPNPTDIEALDLVNCVSAHVDSGVFSFRKNYILHTSDLKIPSKYGEACSLGLISCDIDQLNICDGLSLLALPDPRIPEIAKLPYRIENLMSLYSRVMCDCCHKPREGCTLCLICGKFFCFRQITGREDYLGITSSYSSHAIYCGVDVGIFMNIEKCIITYFYDGRFFSKEAPYISRFGPARSADGYIRMSRLDKAGLRNIIKQFVCNEVPNLVMTYHAE